MPSPLRQFLGMSALLLAAWARPALAAGPTVALVNGTPHDLIVMSGAPEFGSDRMRWTSRVLLRGETAAAAEARFLDPRVLTPGAKLELTVTELMGPSVFYHFNLLKASDPPGSRPIGSLVVTAKMSGTEIQAEVDLLFKLDIDYRYPLGLKGSLPLFRARIRDTAPEVVEILSAKDRSACVIL